MSTAPDPRQNHLLAVLPVADFERLLPHLKLVPLPLGEVLYESGIELRDVYLPTNSIVSLGEPGLKTSEINVETFKGVVQLSGFVNSREDINVATRLARTVNGVTQVKNDMHLKQ